MEELLPFLKRMYKNDWKRIYKELVLYKKTLRVKKKPIVDQQWYKLINLYAIYPDSVNGMKAAPLKRLIPHIKRIKDLGFDAIHILPFLESPMVDKGFDVSNYYVVNPEFGSLQDIKNIMKEAHKQGMRVIMDLVFNHVSDQHEWFRKAMQGDKIYRDYFIHQKSKPIFVEKFHKESAVWAKYVVNERKRDINIAFPERSGDIAHWREGEDGYWYYHTYYPEQIDVNWRNPDVFIEFAKVVMYWGRLGFNFRLDAIPFIGKSAYKELDNNTAFTRSLLASFSIIAETINPESVFIVETYEKEETVIDYFGNTNRKQAQLAYNFHLCNAMWVSIVHENTDYLWKELDTLEYIPAHAEWINFLRNHDELSLAHLNDRVLSHMKKELLPRGAPFREGYGIAGRTYTFLHDDEKRFLNAYLLLASLPGGMLLPYGDEVGKTNIPMEKLSKKEQQDTRNINRGVLTHEELNSSKGRKISERLHEFLDKHKILREYLNIWPKRIDAPKEVFAGIYKAGSSQLITLINISSKEHEVKLDTKDFKIVLKYDSSTIKDGSVVLAPYSGVWLQK